jgi:cytochrome b
MKNKPSIISIIIGTPGFGSGFCPLAPGTAGALLAVIIWFALSYALTPMSLFIVTLALTLIFTLLGTWATKKLMPFWGNDPKQSGRRRDGGSMDSTVSITIRKFLVCLSVIHTVQVLRYT